MTTPAPAVADYDDFERQLFELRRREKAHTREGDAIAAARRRLPMTEVPHDTTVIGPDGPVPFGRGLVLVAWAAALGLAGTAVAVHRDVN